MKNSRYPLWLSHSLLSTWHRHRMLLVILFVLSIVAASSKFLGAFLIGDPPSGDEFVSDSGNEELRICASIGTPFEGMTSLTEVMKIFQQRMSAVVSEREKFLSSPSLWKCLQDDNGSSEPSMPALEALAESLPGWHFNNPDGSSRLQPVTFLSFASIVSEFERAYECKLAEFQEDAFRIVYLDKDFPDPTGLDPTNADFAFRTPAFHALQTIERQRARVALERTILTLRSFEVSYTYAKQLTCFQRASLDLKNELTLLADTASCMPKVWDALTSLHDRKSTQE